MPEMRASGEREEGEVRIRRGYLFWGLVFITLGVIPLMAHLGWFDPGRIADADRLWPIVIIAFGVAILVSRSRAGIAGLVIAALVVGSLGGFALASGNFSIMGLGDCGSGSSADLLHLDRTGAFTELGSVSLHLNCGTVTLTTAPVPEWSLEAGYRGDPPTLSADGSDLSIGSPDLGLRYQEWTVTAPIESTKSIDVHANAGTVSLALTGANLAELTVEGNAGDVLIDASGATIADLSLSINAGRARLTVGGPTSGDLSVNAGSIAICTPANADLQLDVPDHFAFDTNLGAAGLIHSGDTWQRAGSGGPSIHLHVDGNVGDLQLDPIGGCR